MRPLLPIALAATVLPLALTAPIHPTAVEIPTERIAVRAEAAKAAEAKKKKKKRPKHPLSIMPPLPDDNTPYPPWIGEPGTPTYDFPGSRGSKGHWTLPAPPLYDEDESGVAWFVDEKRDFDYGDGEMMETEDKDPVGPLFKSLGGEISRPTKLRLDPASKTGSPVALEARDAPPASTSTTRATAPASPTEAMRGPEHPGRGPKWDWKEHCGNWTNPKGESTVTPAEICWELNNPGLYRGSQSDPLHLFDRRLPPFEPDRPYLWPYERRDVDGSDEASAEDGESALGTPPSYLPVSIPGILRPGRAPSTTGSSIPVEPRDTLSASSSSSVVADSPLETSLEAEDRQLKDWEHEYNLMSHCGNWTNPKNESNLIPAVICRQLNGIPLHFETQLYHDTPWFLWYVGHSKLESFPSAVADAPAPAHLDARDASPSPQSLGYEDPYWTDPLKELPPPLRDPYIGRLPMSFSEKSAPAQIIRRSAQTSPPPQRSVPRAFQPRDAAAIPLVPFSAVPTFQNLPAQPAPLVLRHDDATSSSKSHEAGRDHLPCIARYHGKTYDGELHDNGDCVIKIVQTVEADGDDIVRTIGPDGAPHHERKLVEASGFVGERRHSHSHRPGTLRVGPEKPAPDASVLPRNAPDSSEGRRHHGNNLEAGTCFAMVDGKRQKGHMKANGNCAVRFQTENSEWQTAEMGDKDITGIIDMDGMWHRHARHASFPWTDENGHWHIHPHPRLSEREVEQEGWIDPATLQGMTPEVSENGEDS